jgi:hypothetical protein
MPRVCTVCTHAERKAIDAAIVGGASAAKVAALYRVSDDAVTRHKASHLPKNLTKAKGARDIADADDLLRELRADIERVRLLSDACDRWLRDPEDPARYDVSPRAHEATVIYEEEVEAGERLRTMRRKAPLSTLLRRVEGTTGYTVTAVETKHADPRELLLRSYDRLQKRLELVAKLLGELDERPQINVTMSGEWLTVRSIIVQTLTPFPEARTAVARALSELEGVRNDSQ